MKTVNERSPISKPDFFEPKFKESKKEIFTSEQVTELLKKQIADCADSIQGDNLSEYNAKRKILETKLINF